MNNNLRTFIHFDYGGNYLNNGDEIQWISREDVRHALLMKAPIEQVNYSALVNKICNKMMVAAGTKMKFSYIPVSVNPKKPIYIFDDDDLLCYLEWNQAEFDVMHVELDKDDEQHQGCEQNGVGKACEAGETCEAGGEACEAGGEACEAGQVAETGQVAEELISNTGTCIGDGVMTLYAGETCEQNELPRNYQNVASDEREDMLQIINGDRLQGTRVNVEWEDGVNLTVGQEFGSKKAVQDLLEKQAHKNCFEFVIKKSEPKLYVVKCSEEKKGCKWSLRVAQLKNSECFAVRTYNKMHSCFRSKTSTNRIKRKGTPRLVASVLRDNYPCKLKTLVPKELIPLVQSKAGVKVSYSTAWRGKKEADSDVRGSVEENYKVLHSYLHMLEVVNPGTISFVELDEKKRFQYLFFALGACFEGFVAMREVIIVDGTYLKTSQGGVLIVASAQDPDHHHYLIAFGVVDGEKEASWSWFFNKLKSIIPDGPELVFVSDRCPSLIKSVREVYPLSKHGYCIYHLAQNVKGACSKVIKKTVGKKFITCARSYTEAMFKELYGDFRARYPAGANYLDTYVEEKNWARCYFPGERYNIDTSNSVESINGVFKEARQLSLLPMIDAIVDKLAEWFNKHRKEAVDAPITQMMVPYVEKVLHSRCAEAKLLPVIELNSYFLEYNVIGVDDVGYLVDLKNKTCSCKQFDIEQYPCEHAIAAAMEAIKNIENEIQLEDLCSKYYWMEQWSLAYCRTIYPVPHMSQWVVPDHVREKFTFPPPIDENKKKRGRPRTRRIPSLGEHGRKKRKTTTRSLYDVFRD